MVVVLIIFFMILGFGILFYTQFAKGEASSTLATIDKAHLAEAAKIVAGMPEIHCSKLGDEDLSCIDSYKASVISAKLTGAESRTYAEALQGFRADIECVYPAPCTTIGIANYNLFDYTDPNGKNSQPFFIPVYIYNPSNAKSGYGWIKITMVS